jgi:hypothetical protein
MIANKCGTWFLILLSALLFNGAFFFPEVLGFCILFFPMPLFFIEYSFFVGFMWGILIFGPHFIWLLMVVLQHSQAAILASAAVYLGVVTYFSLSSGLWLWLTRKMMYGVSRIYDNGVRLCRFIPVILFSVSLIMYWLFLEYIIVLPLGLPGYPFINPCIPLASYKLFLKLVTMIALLMGHGAGPMGKPLDALVYVPPVVNRIKNSQALWRFNAEGVGQKIYAVLADCVSNNNEMSRVLVSPESMFPFALNCYPHIVRLWSAVVPTQDHYFVGSVYQKGQTYYQAVYWIHGGLIIKIYVKKILTPFVEKLPEGWRNLRPIKEMFLHDAVEFCDCAQGVGADFFDITSTIRIIPRICLEFFFTTYDEIQPFLAPSKEAYIYFFANDSWFNEFFRKNLYNLAVVRSHWLNVPLIYIGHFGVSAIAY